MKILTLVESSGGGTGRHVLDLAQGLIARGVEVHMLYSTRRIDQLFSERLGRIRGLHHMPLDMRTAPHPSDFGFVRAARRYLKTHGPFDAVHGHSSKGGAIARLVAFGTGVPAFYTPHGLITMDPRLPAWKWLVYLTIELLLSLRTKRIIAVSPEEARAAKQMGFGQARVLTIPNGVGEMDLAPRADARQTMNVSDDALVIGFVGRLVEQKAPDVLLTAFAIAVKSAPHARLAMVGAGPLEDHLRELAWKLGIADKIIWLGERDARTLLAGFDCFALASRKEGLPYVILEAMAAGLPVVATSTAGVEILVDSRDNGLVVPPDDPQAFGQALTDLATNPALLASCARAARIRAARFTVDAMVDATLGAYRDAAADPASSRHPQLAACSVPASAAQFAPSPTR